MPLFGPPDPKKLCEKGEQLMKQGAFQKALDTYQKALELEKRDLTIKALATLNIGACHAKLDNKEEALQYAQKTIDLLKSKEGLPSEEPQDEGRKAKFHTSILDYSLAVQAYLNKGVTLRAMGRLEESRKVLDNLIMYMSPSARSREPEFRAERFFTIAEMIKKEGKATIPMDEVEEKYRELGYSEETLQLDKQAATT